MSTLSALGATASSAPTQESAKEAAEALEAYFLRQLLAEVRPVGGTMGGEGVAGGTFQEMLEGALADAMASGAPFGLAESIEKELQRQGTAIPVGPLAPAAPDLAPLGPATSSEKLDVLATDPLKFPSRSPSQLEGAK